MRGTGRVLDDIASEGFSPYATREGSKKIQGKEYEMVKRETVVGRKNGIGQLARGEG